MVRPVRCDPILVVDDSEVTRELIHRNLASKGYKVIEAPDISAATETLKEQKISLVITDLKMFGGSGLNLIKYVKENFPRTEVAIITGYPSIETTEAALKMGAVAFLCKPFTREELFETVEQALAARKK
ncbi:Two component, sigma54 specific, transcriptional regulator, Fis family (fragment) [Candidatus Zixiibacteriota bacterium]